MGPQPESASPTRVPSGWRGEGVTSTLQPAVLCACPAPTALGTRPVQKVCVEHGLPEGWLRVYHLQQVPKYTCNPGSSGITGCCGLNRVPKILCPSPGLQPLCVWPHLETVSAEAISYHEVICVLGWAWTSL